MKNSGEEAVAIISDIHGNYPALLAVISDIRRSALKVKQIWFLGDLFGYGNQIQQVFDCMNLVIKPDIWLAGNHDLAMVGNRELYSMMNEKARSSIDESKHQITPLIQKKIESLDTHISVSERIPITISHGLPSKDKYESVIYYESQILSGRISASKLRNEVLPKANIWIVGHSHYQTAWLYQEKNKNWEQLIEGFGQRLDSKKVLDVEFGEETDSKRCKEIFYADLSEGDLVILNPGSVGVPRDGDVNKVINKRVSKYLLLTFGKAKMKIEFRVIPY